MVKNRLIEQSLTAIPTLSSGSKNYSWGQRDLSLLYSADVNGSWQIWRHYLDSGILEQFTTNGGIFARDAKDGSIYYVKPHNKGLWQLTEESTLVSATVCPAASSTAGSLRKTGKKSPWKSKAP